MIRPATAADVATIVAIGEAMHAETRYRDPLPWCAPKVAGLVDWLLASDDGLVLVAEDDGSIVGGFLGMVEDHWCSRARVATDFALYVLPAHRGSTTAARLLGAYVTWARDRGAVLVQAGITTGVHVDATSRLYERMGFQRVGNLFEIGAPHG